LFRRREELLGKLQRMDVYTDQNRRHMEQNKRKGKRSDKKENEDHTLEFRKEGMV